MQRRPRDTAVTEFVHAVGLLVRRVRAAAATHELSLTESAVLSRLAREGAATTADLARAESMKPQSMATTVAALEEAGLIERKPHVSDGRQLINALTSKGVAVRNSAQEAKHSWLVQAIAQLDEREQETLLKAGELIRRLAEK
jgi:DNA-binding MarR family transcriptional regulator